ncbi:MAG: ATP-binding protein involved in chromosome partitioning [Chloroflexota bacterium]|jgi:ATP-binding protein involved in chromosome partitioning|nr:ATP-binding protein involved in chromosome partitioning [Chloroflexota bacterium]
MAVTAEQVLDALKVVQDPDLHRDIVSLGFIQNLKIDDNRVAFDVVLTTPACPAKDALHDQARSVVLALPGVSDVNVKMSSNVASSRKEAPAALIPKVRNVVAVASGKGGVGKSTVSTNLALALAQSGASVGLVDADIYGPNIPLMMGLREKPQLYGNEENKIVPVVRFGIKLMSIGFFISDDDSPVIWRGPMVHGAINQFLRDVEWGELDYLVVDLPPGTGDAPLSLAQLVPVAGVVIVTTPQDVALQDVVKGVAMFDKLGVPIVGVIENMSFFACPHCGEVTEIFGHGGGEHVSKKYGIPLLGRIPLDVRIRAGGDEGTPVVISAADSALAKAFHEAAEQTAARISILALETEEEEKHANAVPLPFFGKLPGKA